ncbi:MAG: hypothetical protein ACLR5S_02485 [Ruminococcus sp.]
MQTKTQNGKAGFGSKLGFILAAAGSAVGLETSGVFRTWQQNTAAECFCWSI